MKFTNYEVVLMVKTCKTFFVNCILQKCKLSYFVKYT
nr:MAG TPA: hypothetical protein [Caudoviricetes sp.]